MKYLVLFSILLTHFSCAETSNESGVLKVDAPEGSVLKDKVMGNGVHFYSIKWKRKNEMASVFMISKWPTAMPVSKIPSTVKKIIGDTFASTKKKAVSSIEKDAKIQDLEISEKFVLGNLAYFEHTDEKGNRRVQSIHMVTDGDVIWNGQFSGSKELFETYKDIFKTMKPENQL